MLPRLFEEVHRQWVILPGLVQLGLREPLVHWVCIMEGHQADVTVHCHPALRHGGDFGPGVQPRLQRDAEHQVTPLWQVEALQMLLQFAVQSGLASSYASGMGYCVFEILIWRLNLFEIELDNGKVPGTQNPPSLSRSHSGCSLYWSIWSLSPRAPPPGARTGCADTLWAPLWPQIYGNRCENDEKNSKEYSSPGWRKTCVSFL